MCTGKRNGHKTTELWGRLSKPIRATKRYNNKSKHSVNLHKGSESSETYPDNTWVKTIFCCVWICYLWKAVWNVQLSLYNFIVFGYHTNHGPWTIHPRPRLVKFWDALRHNI